MIFPDYITF